MSNSMSPHGLQHARLPSFTIYQNLLKLMSIELVTPSNHLILCHPLLLLPTIFLNIRVVTNESVLCIRWPKYRNFSFSISLSNEYSGLISFRTDWFDLLAVQGTPKSFLQHHSSKASILWTDNKRISSLAFSMLRPSKSFCCKALLSFMNEVRLKYLKFSLYLNLPPIPFKF